MANYTSKTQTASAIAASANGDSIDVRGYKELAVQVKCGTCTGTGNTDVYLELQTSNDGVNFTSAVAAKKIIDASGNTVAEISGLNYFATYPDGVTAGMGFGRYIRFGFVASGTFSATYTITVECKS